MFSAYFSAVSLLDVQHKSEIALLTAPALLRLLPPPSMCRKNKNFFQRLSRKKLFEL